MMISPVAQGFIFFACIAVAGVALVIRCTHVAVM
jgi:hypothetical protein